MSTAKLFSPVQVGELTLKHRVVMAPLTRFRASKEHVPGPHMTVYYSQRASTPGTLLVTEATYISPEAGGYPNVPGIWSDEQIKAWREIVAAVHAKGSYIFLQLWALGRTAGLYSPVPLVSAGNVAMKGQGTPRPLTVEEIRIYVDNYATAAYNAVHLAGFDGVEIHNANGYLPDQFLQDVSNNRTDQYGGSIENRSRFTFEIVEAISKQIGPSRIGIRFSPWGRVQGMGMADPKPTFSYVAIQLRDRYPALAYIHLVEPRVQGTETVKAGPPPGESNDFLREIWAPRPFISAGGYTRELGIDVAETKGDLIAYGRPFIANPDLPNRLKYDTPLTMGDRKTYYAHGSTDPAGYTDYPFASSPAL